ncbi:serine/threonine protein kinase [Modestobacter sp. VKM Ac-2676]|nr:serine/threonine protein kinase [Modestobacter sp. VKM Ac-2676]
MTSPQVLGERYEIGGVLGRGGMAEVHRGRDLRLGREVAVKVLRQDLARDPSSQVRFRREAQAAASLNHPAIVAVYDTGEDRTTTGATPYIVMEYVEGETLRDVLQHERRLSPERAMSLTADICAALDFSHRNGIVHRDVKPGNVMITPQGTVKVMDFGIARAVSDSAATMTSTAAVIGTAQYLSPEQARGEGVDARSDVYSAGCLLYELVTGTPPFTGDSPVAVAYQHVREDPRTPSSINPEISPELDAIVLKAMSKNPANRYQSAAEMRADLLRAVAGQRVEATPVMSDAEKTTIMSGAAAPQAYADRSWDGGDDEADRKRRRNRVIAAVVAALVLIGVVTGVAIALSNQDDPTTPVAETVSVPTLEGLTRAEALAALVDEGLTEGTITTAPSTEEQRDRVLSSDPPVGTEVEPQTPVDLVIGAGPETLTVPEVIGLTESGARSSLTTAGFTGNVNATPVDSLEPEGRVVAIDPGEGTQAPPEQTFTLGISTGSIELRDVAGLTEEAARQALAADGIPASAITAQNVERNDVAPGTVVGTDPGARTQVSAGDTVTLLLAVPEPADTIDPPPTAIPTATPTETPTTTPPPPAPGG